MSRNPQEDQPSGLQRLQARWLELPLAYRVNALLYILGGLALIFLISTFFSNDNPRQIQVGAGAAATSSTRASSTVPPTTATTSPTTRPSTTAVPTTTATTVRASTAGSPSSGGQSSGGPSTGGGDGDGGSGPTTTEACGRNSAEPSCGDFRWDPQPANEPPSYGPLRVFPGAVAGQTLTFSVDVSEPDHPLDSVCFVVDFGDGSVPLDSGCVPPSCQNRYGPWDPPARPGPGQTTLTFQHTYAQPHPPSDPYILTLRLESRNRDDCDDPYGTALNDPNGVGRWVVLMQG